MKTTDVPFGFLPLFALGKWNSLKSLYDELHARLDSSISHLPLQSHQAGKGRNRNDIIFIFHYSQINSFPFSTSDYPRQMQSLKFFFSRIIFYVVLSKIKIDI